MNLEQTLKEYVECMNKLEGYLSEELAKAKADEDSYWVNHYTSKLEGMAEVSEILLTLGYYIMEVNNEYKLFKVVD